MRPTTIDIASVIRPFVVVEAPQKSFPVGAAFDGLEVNYTLRFGNWPDGLRFLHNNRYFVVRDGKLYPDGSRQDHR